MHEVLVNCLGGLSLPKKSVVRLTDHPDMTLDVYRRRKTTTQQKYQNNYTCNSLHVIATNQFPVNRKNENTLKSRGKLTLWNSL